MRASNVWLNVDLKVQFAANVDPALVESQGSAEDLELATNQLAIQQVLSAIQLVLAESSNLKATIYSATVGGSWRTGSLSET